MSDGDKKPPKVFLSHASEDKERFVLEFARRLRRHGVDAWLDKWEMLPGHSLVEKIFDEGLKDAEAVVVVVSSYSLDKKWVQEELNASIVKRINEGSLLIPIVLDGAQVPEALKSTVWESIDDPSSYDESFERIMSSIFKGSLRPALGSRPKYAVENLPSMYKLADTDVLVFREFGALAIETNDPIDIDTESVWKRVEQLDVCREDFLDALHILKERRYLKESPELAPVPPWFSITQSGLEEYLSRFYPEYPDTFRRVAMAVVNQGLLENYELAKELAQAQVVIDHVIRMMTQRGFVLATEALGGHVWIDEILPPLKRYVRDN